MANNDITGAATQETHPRGECPTKFYHELGTKTTPPIWCSTAENWRRYDIRAAEEEEAKKEYAATLEADREWRAYVARCRAKIVAADKAHLDTSGMLHI